MTWRFFTFTATGTADALTDRQLATLREVVRKKEQTQSEGRQETKSQTRVEAKPLKKKIPAHKSA